MSTQITVRLPDDMVAFVDRLVEDGVASSRATVVARAIERERRRELALKDVQILQATHTADDLDGLAGFGVASTADLD